MERVQEEFTPAKKLIVVETPSNPLLNITDIAAEVQVAHDQGIDCVCDNTWGTPVLQQCLELGAHMVVHSTTKYLGGHGDATGGVMVSAKEKAMFQDTRSIQRN